MKHIYLNLKRFDVPAEMGGVNRICDVKGLGWLYCQPYSGCVKVI